MTDQEKDNAFRELRKLVDIGKKWGKDILVNGTITVKERGFEIIEKLRAFGMSDNDIDRAVKDIKLPLIESSVMYWKKFDRSTCPQDIEMLFLEKNGRWWPGTFKNQVPMGEDPDVYGWLIATFETYAHVDNITHYLEVVLPS